MKILFIWRGTTEIGGVSTWLLRCLERFPELGCDAYVLDITIRPKRQLNCDSVGKRIIRIVPQKKWESEASYYHRIGRAVNRIAPDLLIFNEQVYAEDVLVSTHFKIPSVNIVHSDRENAYPILKELIGWNVPQLCVSRTIAGKITNRVPPPMKGLIHEIILGIDLPEKVRCDEIIHDEIIRLIYVGRLTCYQKEILDVVPFINRLVLLGTRFHLDVVGDGDDRSLLYDKLSSANLLQYVTFHGAVSQKVVFELLMQQHVILLFSTFEGLPLALLEAMARGVVPVVTSLDSGVSDIVRECSNGRLFPVGRPDMAAAIVCELSSNRSVLASMSKKAAETSLQFSYLEQSRRIVDLLKQWKQAPIKKRAQDACAKKSIGHLVNHYLPMSIVRAFH